MTNTAVGQNLLMNRWLKWMAALAEPQVSLTRSALVGAAMGTAVLPGVGTGAGASLGERLGNGLKKLFGP